MIPCLYQFEKACDTIRDRGFVGSVSYMVFDCELDVYYVIHILVWCH